MPRIFPSQFFRKPRRLVLLTLTGALPVLGVFSLAQAALVNGTELADQLVGTPSADAIYGYGGQDQILGYGGNDLLEGGAGGDQLLGGDGDDVIYKGPGNDHVFGEAGNDRVVVRHACELQQGSVNLNGDGGTDVLVLPVSLATFLAGGHVALGFESVISDTSLGCDSPCAPASECPDTSTGSDTSGSSSTGSDTSTFDETENHNDTHANDWTINDTFGDNDTVPGETPQVGDPHGDTQGEDGCLNRARLVYETSCQHSPEAEFGPVAGVGPCNWGDLANRRWVTARTTSATCLQEMKYCTQDGTTTAWLDDGEGNLKPVSRPKYKRIYFPTAEPEPSAGTICAPVPTNPACADLRLHPGFANDIGGTTTAGCAAMPAGSNTGACTTDAQCVQPNGQRLLCVGGRCSDCAEFVECADPKAEDPVIEDIAPMPFTEPSALPKEANAANKDKTPRPSLVPISDNAVVCTTPNSCRSHETRFNFCIDSPSAPCPAVPDSVATDMRGVDPCEWQVKTTSESGNTPHWGLGGDAAPGTDPDEDRPGYWHRQKGNERFNLDLTAQVEQEGSFAGAFADGSEFKVGAASSFVLNATLWKNVVPVIEISGEAGAELCGVTLHAAVKVLGNYVGLNGEDLVFPGDGSPADDLLETINEKRETCRGLVDSVNGLRKKANELAYDSQTAIDFLKAFGNKSLRNGVEEVWVENLIDTSSAPTDFAHVPPAFGQTECKAVLQSYESVVGEYLESVEALHVALQDLSSTFASKDFLHGEAGQIAFERVFPEGSAPGKDSQHTRIFGIDQSYPVGPFEIGMEVSASGSYSLAVAAGVDWQAKGVGSFQLGGKPDATIGVEVSGRGTGQVTPHFAADVQLALYAGIGNKFAGVNAGIRAKLLLAELAFPLQAYAEVKGTIGAKVKPNARLLNPQTDAAWGYKWGLGASAVLRALDGSLDLFVRARLGFLSKSWVKNLATWNGIQRKFTLLAIEKPADPSQLGVPVVNDAPLSATISAPSFPKLSCDHLGALDGRTWTPSWIPGDRTAKAVDQEAIWSSALATVSNRAKPVGQNKPSGEVSDSRCYRDTVPPI